MPELDGSSPSIGDTGSDETATSAKTDGIRQIEEIALGRREKSDQLTPTLTDTHSKQTTLCQIEQQAAQRESAKGGRQHEATPSNQNSVQDDETDETDPVAAVRPGAYRVIPVSEERTPGIDEDQEQPLPRNETTSVDQHTITAVVVNEEEERARVEQATREYLVESAAQVDVVDVRKRRCILGIGVLLALVVVITLTVIFVEKSSAKVETVNPTPSPTVNLIESLEWVDFANKITLSPSVLTYPATEGASTEERALAWLIEESNAAPEKTATQRYAFVVLAFAMEVPDWKLEFGFDECELEGVECDSEHTAIKIDLRSGGMKGSIPDDIALLSGLQTVVFWDNYLTGTVPWDHMMNHMKELNFLDLDVNKLTGFLPNPTTGSWPKLEIFWARKNRFQGTLSSGFANLPILHDLYVKDNELTGTIPTELGEITTMKWFAIDNNAFRGSLPTEIGQWTKMVHFEVGGNDITGTIPTEIGHWTDLESLFCYSNKFHGTIPTEIVNFRHLERFQIQFNDFTGPFPSPLGGWTNLKVFYINSNKFTGPLPQGMEKWKDLEEVKVDINEFTGAISDDLGTWTDLKIAHFQVNSLIGTTQSLCDVVSHQTIVFADCCEVLCPCCTTCFADVQNCEVLS